MSIAKMVISLGIPMDTPNGVLDEIRSIPGLMEALSEVEVTITAPKLEALMRELHRKNYWDTPQQEEQNWKSHEECTERVLQQFTRMLLIISAGYSVATNPSHLLRLIDEVGRLEKEHLLI